MSDRTLADRLGDLISRAENLRAVDSLAHPYAVETMRRALEALIDRVLVAKSDDERREAAAEARAVRSLLTWMEGVPRALKAAEDQIDKLKKRETDHG